MRVQGEKSLTLYCFSWNLNYLRLVLLKLIYVSQSRFYSVASDWLIIALTYSRCPILAESKVRKIYCRRQATCNIIPYLAIWILIGWRLCYKTKKKPYTCSSQRNPIWNDIQINSYFSRCQRMSKYHIKLEPSITRLYAGSIYNVTPYIFA